MTVDDYLAQRDAKTTVRCSSSSAWRHRINLPGMPAPASVKHAADITYGHQQRIRLRLPARQHGVQPEERVQLKLHYALVGEVDPSDPSEAHMLLIISGPAEDSSEMYISTINP